MGVDTVYSALSTRILLWSSPHFKGAIYLCEIFELWKFYLRIKSWHILSVFGGITSAGASGGRQWGDGLPPPE